MTESIRLSYRQVLLKNVKPRLPALGALRRFVAELAATSPRHVAESIAIALGLGFIEGVGLLLLVPLLQLVGVDAQQGSLGGIIARFSALFGAVGVTPTLPIVLGIYLTIVLVQAALQRRQATLSATLQFEIVGRLRTRIYRAVANTKWVYLAKTRASDYAHLLTEEVDRIALAAYFLIELTATIVISIAYVLLAFRISPTMTAIVVLCGLALAVGARQRLIRARARGQQRSAVVARLYAAVGEHLASMKMAKGYGAESRHAELFDRLSRDVGDMEVASAGGYAALRQWLTIGSSAVLAMIVYVAYGVLGISTASLLLLLFLYARLVPRLTSIYERTQAITMELPAFEAVLAAEQRCLDAAEPQVLSHREVTFTDRVELDRVTFTYSDDQTPAVHEVELLIPVRSTTAIVGPSGSGKSTIADLLMGLLEPTAGRVLVDGISLAPEAFQAWRDHIGYVSQDTFLFHDTVLANLLWARPDATLDQVWRALTMAAADEFVRGLPLGLETVVGDRGVLVSGGERQRLSLARALLRHPRLLILDEATSALDSDNERRIQDAIDQLHDQITIVVITHRLSTIRNADLIHVIERGRRVESGTWNTLTADPSSRFRDLCRAQGIDPDAARAASGASVQALLSPC